MSDAPSNSQKRTLLMMMLTVILWWATLLVALVKDTVMDWLLVLSLGMWVVVLILEISSLRGRWKL